MVDKKLYEDYESKLQPYHNGNLPLQPYRNGSPTLQSYHNGNNGNSGPRGISTEVNYNFSRANLRLTPGMPSSDDSFIGNYSETEKSAGPNLTEFASIQLTDSAAELWKPQEGLNHNGRNMQPGLVAVPRDGTVEPNPNKPPIALSGPHTHHGTSLIWTSAKEATRVRYHKNMAKFYHMGFGNSPFIPKTFAEWSRLKNDQVGTRLAYYQRQLQQSQSELAARRQELAIGSDIARTEIFPTLSSKLKSTAQRDCKSTVLARDSIWTTTYTDDPETDWPPYVEFKREGDDRVRGWRDYGRQLPLPRMRTMANMHYKHLYLDTKPTDSAIKGPDVPYHLRKINPDMCSVHKDTMPQTEDAAPVSVPPGFRCGAGDAEQIGIEELDGFTRELIEEIDNME
ncbi:hypothetical protein TruAng_011755 [Truncatella angustata]|nr:hypothetical protein TruAng_011755 [Truncatella angustata]